MALALIFCLTTSAGTAESDFENAVSAAKRWLATDVSERGKLADSPEVDIMRVIDAIRPKGDPAHIKNIGEEIKGDTFSIPRLLARNEDHPFNFYVPSHYDPEEPMGLILFLHGGGTYKPGANVKRRSVSGKIKELEQGNYILVAAEACHGVNFPPGAVPDKLANR